MIGWYFLLAILITICAALMAGGFWISGLLRNGYRHPLSWLPTNVGLTYEDISFKSSDGLTLKGWWLPAIDDPQQVKQCPAVVLLHPWFGNRHGFNLQHQGKVRLFHTNVDLLQTARIFHEAGFSVLMFDFRSSGESQSGICAGGLTEDQDVTGAVAYVFNRLSPFDPLVRPSQQRVPSVGVVGFGLGAAAALAAIGRTKGGYQTVRVFSGDMEGGVGYSEIPPSPVKQLKFVILIQPASMGTLVRNYLSDRLAFLGRLLVPVVDWSFQWRGGHSFQNTALDRFVPGTQMPVMLLQARDDPWGSTEEVKRIYESLTGDKKLMWLDGIHGRMETYNCVWKNPHDILTFASQCTTIRSNQT